MAIKREQLMKLNPNAITSIEIYASEHQLDKEKRGYKTAVSTLAKMYGISTETVIAVIEKDIGERWKQIKNRYCRYKISNFGRIKGPKGNIVRSYINNSGAEQVDPYDNEGKRGHLSIKKAVCDAFFPKLKKNQKFAYAGRAEGLKNNTIYGIVILA